MIGSLAAATVAAGLLLAGGVLLARAAWLSLAAALSPVWAHVILGGGLVLVALLVFWALSARRPEPDPPPIPRDQIVDLVVAFLEGVTAGRAARRKDR